MEKEQNDNKDKDNVKPLLKHKASEKEKTKKKKSVVWDVKTLEEQELDRKLHPVLMKINEPKTPYTPYEEGDDEYLKKLNEVNKIQPTDELLDEVLGKLQHQVQRKDSSTSEEYLEVEVVEADGTVKKELVKKEKQHTKDFEQKRHKAYVNEFTQAKKYFQEHNIDLNVEDNNEPTIEDVTINNTLLNKFVGKVHKKEG